MTYPIERYRFTVDEYDRLGEAGILGEDDPVELIEGELSVMTPIGRRHAACVDRLNRLLSQRVGDQAIVRVQSPVRLDDHTEPQPDMALLCPREDFYANAHPGPDDLLLVIEVADSSVGYDREVKLPLYARASVVEVWIVDLGRSAIEAHREPRTEGYAERKLYRGHDELRLDRLDLRLCAEEVLPT